MGNHSTHAALKEDDYDHPIYKFVRWYCKWLDKNFKDMFPKSTMAYLMDPKRRMLDKCLSLAKHHRKDVFRLLQQVCPLVHEVPSFLKLK